VAIEKEAAVLTDHDYDGIRELDNALPPWWKYGFYLTIVWAVIYMVYYHVSEAGPLMEEEYQIELAEGRRAVEEYRARAQNLVDESNVAVLTDDGALAQGGKLFGQYCAVCHAADGGGIVGPNLTDVYWLHGGDIKSLFTVVKYGVQGKGMKSWQQELSPAMMAQVTSYILSMQGTTPAKPKDPEGVRYEPQLSAAPADSLTVAAGNQADTTITAATN
jgi:cytochrome c oxidase cbb3-type subunit 3